MCHSMVRCKERERKNILRCILIDHHVDRACISPGRSMWHVAVMGISWTHSTRLNTPNVGTCMCESKRKFSPTWAKLMKNRALKRKTH